MYSIWINSSDMLVRTLQKSLFLLIPLFCSIGGFFLMSSEVFAAYPSPPFVGTFSGGTISEYLRRMLVNPTDSTSGTVLRIQTVGLEATGVVNPILYGWTDGVSIGTNSDSGYSLNVLGSGFGTRGKVNTSHGYCISGMCISSWAEVAIVGMGSGTQYFVPLWASGAMQLVDSIIFQTNGKIGINNINPLEMVDVGGNVRANGFCIGIDCRLSWNDVNIWGLNGSDAYYTGGRIGIGVTSPTQMLDVAGIAKTTGGYCIGSNCIANWPSVAPYLSGSDITFSGSPSRLVKWNSTGTGFAYSGIVFDNGIGISVGGSSVTAGYILDIIGQSRTQGDIHPGMNNIYDLGSSLYAWRNVYIDGQVLSDSGTSSSGAPSYTWEGDQDTGMFHPSVNTVAFSTNGGEKMRINALGRIGINTTAPTQQFHVNGTIRAQGIIRGSDGTAAAPEYTFESEQDVGMFRPGANILAFSTNGSERLRMNNVGNIGIATTSPGYRLDVQGGQVNAASGFCINGSCINNWSSVGAWTLSGNNLFNNVGTNVVVGGTTSSSGAFAFEAQGGYISVGSGYCIGSDCKTSWSQVATSITGNPDYLPKQNGAGNGLINSNIYETSTGAVGFSGTLIQGTIPWARLSNIPNASTLGSGIVRLTNSYVGTSATLAPNQQAINNLYTYLVGYTDNAIAGLSWKQAVKATTTGNIALNGLTVVDGYTPSAGDRILVKDQTVQSENGIYVASAGAWVRSNDTDSGSEFPSLAVYIQEGTTYKTTGWVLSTQGTIVPGTTNLTFSQFSGNGAYAGTLPIVVTGNNISINQSNTTTNGYLSSGDWNIFNNKEPAITAGTNLQYYRGDKTWQDFAATLTGTLSGGAISPILTANLATSRALISNISGKITTSATTAVQIGYLSTTTSDVQTQLNNRISSTGTANYIPTWTPSGTGLTATSLLYITSTGVGVSTTSPGYRLDIQGGQANTSSGYCINGVCVTSWTGASMGPWTLSGTIIMPNNISWRMAFGKTTMGSGKYSIDIGSGFLNSMSGLCINNSCLTDWTDLNNLVKSKGTSHYLAKFDSGGYIGDSSLYETGSQLWIQDIDEITNDWGSSPVNRGAITIANYSAGPATSGTNPLLTLRDKSDGKTCGIWLGVGKIQSNCTWDTGGSALYTPDNVIKYAADGSQTGSAIYSDTAGDVGIGISNPLYKLDVGGNSQFAGDVFPSASTLYNLGLTTNRWNNLYLGANIDLAAASRITGNLTPSANYTYDLGSSLARWKTLYSGTGVYGNYLLIGSNTLSSTNYKLDIFGGYANSSSGFCINGSCVASWTGISAGPWSINGTGVYNNTGNTVIIGGTTSSSGGYKLDVKGYANSSSGLCINGSCLNSWSAILSVLQGSGNYIPKWNSAGTAMIPSRLKDDGVDISIATGSLQLVNIDINNQSQYNQVLISSTGILKQGLTQRDKLRIFAYSAYGANGVQEMCRSDSTGTVDCGTNSNDHTNVMNYNNFYPTTFTGGIGDYKPASGTKPGYFVSNYTGTYMVVTSYTFESGSFDFMTGGCNFYPYYSVYTNSGSLPALRINDGTNPAHYTVQSDGVITASVASTNLNIPDYRTKRLGVQFVANVFLRPKEVLLITMGFQDSGGAACKGVTDRKVKLVANDTEGKMLLSIIEL